MCVKVNHIRRLQWDEKRIEETFESEIPAVGASAGIQGQYLQDAGGKLKTHLRSGRS